MIKYAIKAKKGRLLPAYPLFVKDPFFSIWSPGDKLNGSDTIFWNTMRRRLFGVVHANGKAYSFLGLVDKAEQLRQVSVAINAFSTEYVFSSGEFDLTVTFTSPLPPDDLDVLSCPVCYFAYSIKPVRPLKNVSVALFMHEENCYNTKAAPVRGGVHVLQAGKKSAWFGLKKQLVMSQAFDSSAAEWGYWFLTGSNAAILTRGSFDKYLMTGVPEFGFATGEKAYIAAVDSYETLEKKTEGLMSVAFDDTVSIFYFGEWLRGYWFDGGRSIFSAIETAHAHYNKVMKKLEDFSRDVYERAARYGEDYLLVLYGGLRQAVGAHKLVRDREGNILFLSKECNSNGCIGTVDLSYPSMPLFLMYNPELVRGMMRPIFKFAASPAWKYDFAPHDVGTYPYCLGQIYGLKKLREEISSESADMTNHCRFGQEDIPYNYPLYYNFPDEDMYDFEKQMPVEESGNMLILAAAALLADGDDSLIKENADVLESWVKYLVKYGLMPGNQLCTDDFAGHLDKNINLSVKAIVGIRAYAVILDRLGKKKQAAEYVRIAEEYAAEWKKMCVRRGEHTPLVFDGGADTFSLKYNMAFDVMFGTGLFDSEVRETEVDCYIDKANDYGTPLDSRSAYTKSDWILWATTLSDDLDKRKKMIAPVARFLRESNSRAPFTDWYFTDTGLIRGGVTPRGTLHGFMNRSVQGGLFAPLLADSGIMCVAKEKK